MNIHEIENANMMKVIIILISIYIPFTALASETHTNWSDGSTFTRFHGDEEWVAAGTHIAYFSGGKYLNFSIVPSDGEEACRLGMQENTVREMVFFVNGQAIQGYFFCNKFSDTGNRWYDFRAKTTAGINFIIDTFYKSNVVSIKNNLKDFNVNAKGFIQEWEQGGDKAL